MNATAAYASPPSVTKSRVLTAMSTTLRSGHPLLVIGATRPLQFPETQRYSKWSVLFEDPVRIDEIHIESCDAARPFEDGVELFTGLDDLRLFAEGGKSSVKFKLPRTRARNVVRALTLGFLESQAVCLKSVSFYTDGKVTELIVPEVVAAKGPVELGDGRIDFSHPRSESSRGPVQLSWDRNLIIEGVRVWNGNQAAGDQYLESPRGRLLKISVLDENGKEVRGGQSWNLEDRRGFQKFDWPQATTSRGLKLEVPESFPPLTNVAVVSSNKMTKHGLSELHLLAGGTIWVPGVMEASAEGEFLSIAARQRMEELKSKGFEEILDRELRSDSLGAGKAGKNQDIWKFRFRSDGTVAAKVFTDRARTPKAWTLLGTWEVATPSDSSAETKSSKTAKRGKGLLSKLRESSDPLIGIGLRVVGVRYATAEFADSLTCGNQCFSSTGERGPASTRELPVNEYLEIQLGESKNQFFLRNRSNVESRTLDFSDLKLRKHTAID